MKKLGYVIIIFFFTPVISGIYGILHDQLTFTISPEYFTKFKFDQFGLLGINQRVDVAVVGFLATWWVGVFIGLFYGIILLFKDTDNIIRIYFKVIGYTLTITFISGLIGLTYGWFRLAKDGVNWWLPENLIDKEHFIAVGSMHNFGYAGGLIGLCVGCIYLIVCNKNLKENV